MKVERMMKRRRYDCVFHRVSEVYEQLKKKLMIDGASQMQWTVNERIDE